MIFEIRSRDLFDFFIDETYDTFKLYAELNLVLRPGNTNSLPSLLII